jgi:hypothetical protein
MRDEWINERNTPDADAEANREMELRLIRALETKPAVIIPADFAARVTSQLPERKPISLTPTHYGRKAMIVCMVALGIALLVAFALHGIAVSPIVQVIGWILYAQFLALVVWFGMRGALRELS